jgi:electron transfer flavoprotein alpha subunit
MTTGPVLVVVEHDRGAIVDGALEVFSAGRALAAGLGAPMHALTIGADADALAANAARGGASVVHQAHHELLTDYGPETWAVAIAHATSVIAPSAVVAAATERGNELMAGAAARLDLPLATNCTAVEVAGPIRLTRARWGGSLSEIAELDAPVALLTFARQLVNAPDPTAPGAFAVAELTPAIDPDLTRSVVRDREPRRTGLTLSTARVVVGGGRGVGSAHGFAPLEQLAELLGGVVGCSRAVTNLGWRDHADQVGQTGTRIRPDVYIACGISGAAQHWVGAMASRHVVAINTDPDANMVTKAGHAVIGDLHHVVPAIYAEIRRRRAGEGSSAS